MIAALILAALVGAPLASPAPDPEAAAPAGADTYRSGGRRDPFVPFGRSEPRAVCRASGLAGRIAAELALRGVVRDQHGPAALLQDPHGRSFLARPGDPICDGVVEGIRPGSVRFRIRDVGPDLRLHERILEVALHPER